MNAIVDQYYTHHRSPSQEYPLVDDIETPIAMDVALWNDKPLAGAKVPYRFAFQPPIPAKPRLADYHSYAFPIVSTRIKDAIEQAVSGSAEMVPAQLETNDGAFPYWLIHSLKNHEVLDMGRSKVELAGRTEVSWIDKLILSPEKIESIPLKERMLFLIGNTSCVYLWHEDIKNAVEALEPTGIVFAKAQGYSQDDVFRH